MPRATTLSANEASHLRPTVVDEERRVALSVVVPVFNEQDNVVPLLGALAISLEATGRSYEVIVVDDGSTDETYPRLARQAELDDRVRLVKLRRNYGQTAALAAGFDHARGEVIVTLDGDLQNDPADIAMLLAKLDEGYDLVSGWRQNRQDNLVRRVPSRVANWLIGLVTGVRLHDYGCTLKAYRRSVIDGIRLYGEMHRFIPIYASEMGARISEVPVRHRARAHGRSKYGLERIVKVTLDLLLIHFMRRHMARPIHLFGGFGLLLLASSLIAFTAMVIAKLGYGVSMILTPLPLLSAIFFVLGINTILLGLIAEILMRTYFESQERSHYILRAPMHLEKDT